MKKWHPLVSIIVPVYNGEHFIDRCVSSAINQTYKFVEIILVNAGSTDKSGIMCDAYASEYDGVVSFHHNYNCGPSEARNTGIKNCNGSLIYFLDVDDSIELNTIEILVEEYEKNDVEMVVGDFFRVTDNIKSASGNDITFSEDTILGDEEILSYVRQYLKAPYKFLLFNHIWNKLYNTGIIRENRILFNPELRNLEDVDFNYKYLNYVKNVYFKNCPLYNYTIRKTSQSFVIGDDLKDVAKYSSTFETVKAFLLNKELDKSVVDKEVGHLFISYTIIILIRLCGSLNYKNIFKIYRNVSAIVSSPQVRNNLEFYSPTPSDIRYAHVLMRYKLNALTMATCWRRFNTHRKFREKKNAINR